MYHHLQIVSTLNLVKLGGNLTEPTTIFTDEENTLGIIGDDINAFSVNRTTFSVDGKNNRVGIGTATPTQTLDIVGKTKITDANSTAESPALDVSGKVKIVDGTQGVDKILTSDENGVASWKASRAGEIIEGAFYDPTNYDTPLGDDGVITITESDYIKIGSITLEKGNYIIFYGFSSSTSGIPHNAIVSLSEDINQIIRFSARYFDAYDYQASIHNFTVNLTKNETLNLFVKRLINANIVIPMTVDSPNIGINYNYFYATRLSD